MRKKTEGVYQVRVKVTYKREKFTVCTVDKIKIEWIKMILLLKRVKRRFFLTIPQNLVMYILLTLCWIVFGVITYYVGIQMKEPDSYTVMDVVWELKNSYFSSVILAVFIAGYSQSSEYKKKISVQHDFYVDSMRTFDYIFEPFVGNKIYHFMPFYNQMCLEDTLEYVKDCKLDNTEVTLENYKDALQEAIGRLEKIDFERKNNNIIGMHKQELGYSIDSCMTEIRKTLKEVKTLEQARDSIPEVAYDLFYVIADIRRPWRWDIENDKKILTLLANYSENNIGNDFYYSMHLYGCKRKLNK